MKKSILFLVVLCFLFVALGGSALAADFQWPRDPAADFEFDRAGDRQIPGRAGSW